MSIATYINEAADMIALFDKGAANIYRNQPFRRAMIVEAFNSGFKTHSELSRKVVEFATKVAEMDINERKIAALKQ